MALHGWEAAQERIRIAAKERDGAAMAAAVPDDMIDAIGVACTPADLADRLAVHQKDFDHLNLAAPVWGLAPDDAEQATRQILEAMSASSPSRAPSLPIVHERTP